MSFLKNKKGSLLVLQESINDLEKISYTDDQKVVFVNSKKVKIYFDKPEYKSRTKKEEL